MQILIRRKWMPSRKAGFTLLELLIVVLIITILGGVVGVQLAGRPHEARVAATKAQLENFRLALQMYSIDQGQYPTMRQGLPALVEPSNVDPRPRRFPQDGYLERREIPLDPWGNPYVYLVPGTRGEPFEVLSYGRDGQPGGAGEDADISTSDL
jgi:general secretion pathway protein G